MIYIILITGIIFLLINILIKKIPNENFNSNIVYSASKNNLYDILEDDVKQELNNIYNIEKSQKYINHNNNANKYSLTTF
jgi:hypothetical protein